MARKLLVPVFPSERFYDAVVAAGDLVAQEGGLVVFLFTQLRPPPLFFADDADGMPSTQEVEEEIEPEGDVQELEAWRRAQIDGLADARALLYERGLTDANIEYVFGDLEEGPAQAIADEAAAGGYDGVVLSNGYFIDMPASDTLPQDVAAAVQELGDVALIVS